MKKTSHIFLFFALITGQMLVFADRGVGKKKNKVVMNIKAPMSFTAALSFNLKHGMNYTGSLMPTAQNTLITYQKGNSIYILPYKQKVLVADVRQGFVGTKLIIRVR